MAPKQDAGTNEQQENTSNDEKLLAALGYKQELNRSWSGFSNFAISIQFSMDQFSISKPKLRYLAFEHCINENWRLNENWKIEKLKSPLGWQSRNRGRFEETMGVETSRHKEGR